MLCARGRFVVTSRYKGLRDDLCGRRQGLHRHRVATVCVTSNRGPLVGGSFSVWAFWATSFDNCWCASDL